MVNQIILKKIIYIFLFFYSLNYLLFTFRFFNRENGFILGDWLINYSGGFVRRGLSGEINIFLSNFFNINIINTSFIVVAFFFIYFIYYFIKLIKNSNISFVLALIIFSPSALLFSFFDPLAVGRKEIIFFLYLLIYFEIRDKKNFNLILIPVSLLVMFSHEIFILLTPFYFVSRYLIIKKVDFKNFMIEFFILIISILYFLSLIFFSDPDTSQMCLTITEFNISDNACWSIFATNNKTPFHITHYISDVFYINYYTIFFILIFLPIYFGLTEIFRNKKVVSILLILITIFPFFSLFLIVNDWGRYLNIFSVYWMIILLQMSKKALINYKLNNFHLIIIFLFSTSWYMPHCCPEIHFKNKVYNPSLKYFIERIHFRLEN